MRRREPAAAAAVQKTRRKAETIDPEVKEVPTGDREGAVGDMHGYVSTWEYRWVQEVYRDWLHYNDRLHLSGGITDD